MSKKELRKTIDKEIMWSLKFAIDEVESDTCYDWYIKQHCDKIQGMLLVAKRSNLIDYEEWQTCMKMINGFGYCYVGHNLMKTDSVSYKYW